MSSSHRAFIAKLQRDMRWLVSGQSPDQIQLTKGFGGTAVTVLLNRNRSGTYSIDPVTYAFKSTISHYDYPTEEERRIRNKNVFKSLIKTLKRVGIWDGVENSDSFIRINDRNKKSNKDKLKKEFRDITA